MAGPGQRGCGLVLAVLATLLLPRQVSLAEVATAVLDQPWVHLRVAAQDRREGDEWFSPSRQVWASRHADSIQYEDYRLQLYDWFKPEENVVYRGPVVWRSRGGDLESMTAALRVLLQQGQPPENPLAGLDFLGPEREAMKVLDQRVDRVTEQGHAWLDYRLTVTDPKSTLPVKMLFRVDADSKLPRLCRVEGVQDGKPVTVETQFDYPEKGPRTSTTWGCPGPRSSSIACPPTTSSGSSRPSARVANGWTTIARSSSSGWTASIPCGGPSRRRSSTARETSSEGTSAGTRTGDRAATKRPAEGEDLARWWIERAEVLPVLSRCASCGARRLTRAMFKTHHRSRRLRASGDRVGLEVGIPPTSPARCYPPEWSMRPEFACRPPLGIGDPHQEPAIDLHPTEGPEGCILLTMSPYFGPGPRQ